MQLNEFNELPADEARQVTRVWAAIPAWVDEIVAARPFASVDDAAATADAAARSWSRGDLDAALAHHPRIGEKAHGSDAESAASRQEQKAMSAADESVVARMQAANAAYEERFGRVFLIRAAGRSADEMLAEIHRRLDNDHETEAREAVDQLREIALLRLRSTLEE